MINYSFKKHLFESILVNESYKDAFAKFSANNDEIVVKDTLDKFKKLSQENRIKSEDKDITKWMSKPFEELEKFVKHVEVTPSNKQAKKTSKKDVIKLKAWNDWIAIVPLTTEASIQYGANTKWCTAATDSENYFHSYFNTAKVTLIYFINKKTNTKYAASFSKKNGIACFDSADEMIEIPELTHAVGISEDEFNHLIDVAIEHDSVKDTRAKAYIKELAQEWLAVDTNDEYFTGNQALKLQDGLTHFIKANTAKLDPETLEALEAKLKEVDKHVVQHRKDEAYRAKGRKSAIINQALLSDIEDFEINENEPETIELIIATCERHLKFIQAYQLDDEYTTQLANQVKALIKKHQQ